jgi:hypothetical protein
MPPGKTHCPLAAFTFSVALASLAFALAAADSITGAFELCNHHGLIEFGDGAEDLPNQLGRWAVIEKG